MNTLEDVKKIEGKPLKELQMGKETYRKVYLKIAKKNNQMGTKPDQILVMQIGTGLQTIVETPADITGWVFE